MPWISEAHTMKDFERGLVVHSRLPFSWHRGSWMSPRGCSVIVACLTSTPAEKQIQKVKNNQANWLLAYLADLYTTISIARALFLVQERQLQAVPRAISLGAQYSHTFSNGSHSQQYDECRTGHCTVKAMQVLLCSAARWRLFALQVEKESALWLFYTHNFSLRIPPGVPLIALQLP